MCRIFGISYGPNPESIDATEIASILFPALVHQGPHAWGWMTWNPQSTTPTQIQYFKTPGRCDSKKARERQLREIPSAPKWLVCHLRYATHGKPQQNVNNHPIPHGHIIGIHNGVLRNHENILKTTGREDDKAIVDSEAIFAAVNKWGPVKGLKKIQGDMVTVWADDRKPHRIHLARSHGRQVTIGWTTNNNIIFASEKQALLRLAPHVQFVKFSTVQENRFLTIEGGHIIDRKTYAPPAPPRFFPPTPIQRPITRFEDWRRERDRDLAVLVSDDPYTDLMDEIWTQERERDKAKRRGELLFPSKPERTGKRKTKIRTTNVDEIVDITSGPLPEPQDNKLYYFDGELMTADEYRLAMEDI